MPVAVQEGIRNDLYERLRLDLLGPAAPDEASAKTSKPGRAITLFRDT